MVPDEQHIVGEFFAPILDYAAEQIGPERLAKVLARCGTTEAALRVRTTWVSSALTEQLCEALVEESGNPDFVAEAGRLLVTGSYMGPFKPLLRFFGSPGLVYGQFPAVGPRFNKTGTWTLHELTHNRAVLSFESTIEKSIQMCRGRASQIAVLPVLFGLAPARINHTECLHHGGARCVYELEWKPRRGTLSVLAPRVLLGGAALIGCGLAFSAPPLALAGFAAGGALGGALWAWTSVLERQLDSRGTEMLEQSDALGRTLEINERRYAELLEAKASVESQVVDRTRELKLASEQLSHALDEVRALDEVKTRFFSNVSHELRTPLQLLLGPLEDLVQGREPVGGTPASLQAMQRSARRLHQLINQLLDLARVDAGAESLRRAAVEPGELLTQIASTFAAAAKAKGLTLSVAAEPIGTLLLDLHWIESAVTNLTANALRHCDGGASITLRAGLQDEHLVLQVIDTGPGIPAADLPRIFDRFAQSAQKENGSRGTGLGLAIVYEAARLHGGGATVTSELGHGATFTLTLPVVRGADQAKPAAVAQRPEVAVDVYEVSDTDITEYPGPSEDAPLALIAEDQPDLRRFVANVLCARYRVVACANGRIALEQSARRAPDLVVTDRSMPEMNGLELCRGLRAASSTHNVPVILLTAHQSLQDVLAGYDAGADDYITKPFHPRELLARAEVHVGLRELNRQAAVRERLASIGMLAAEIAHHVRNPLNVIKNGLPLVRQSLGEGQKKPASLLDVMSECTERIELLTVDLLQLAAGQRHHERLVFDPSDGLQAAVRVVSTGLPDGVQIELRHRAEGSLLGAPGDLNQVFLNLLANAVKAVAEKGTVRVTTETTDGRLVVMVEDSGEGVAEGTRGHLFEPHLTSRGHRDGVGLGLSIVANVVREHGGTIEVGTSSSLGGALFVVSLPLHDVTPERATIADSSVIVNA